MAACAAMRAEGDRFRAPVICEWKTSPRGEEAGVRACLEVGAPFHRCALSVLELRHAAATLYTCEVSLPGIAFGRTQHWAQATRLFSCPRYVRLRTEAARAATDETLILRGPTWTLRLTDDPTFLARMRWLASAAGG